MNKCNIPKKKTLVLSNSKFSQDTVIVYKKADEWYIGWQRMTTSSNKWQWMAANDSGTTNENDTVHFKEWMTAILSVTKTDALLSGMDACNKRDQINRMHLKKRLPKRSSKKVAGLNKIIICSI